jgi:hypothetical protein
MVDHLLCRWRWTLVAFVSGFLSGRQSNAIAGNETATKR